MSTQDPILEYMTCDPEICGGAPTFKNTRLLVIVAIDTLRGGTSPEELLEMFPPPTLTPARVAAVLEVLKVRPTITEDELAAAIKSGKGLRYFLETPE